jgi:hypothetical protein
MSEHSGSYVCMHLFTTAFSKWFLYFGELRSICPSATLLVLRFRSLEETEFEISRHKRNNTVTKVFAPKKYNACRKLEIKQK